MQALRCRERFGMGHTFCYRKQIQTGLLDSIPREWIARCSIRKILRTIITLLKINLFESALLGWLLKKGPAPNLDSIDLASNSLLEDESDKKAFQLLLIRGYYVKNYLADERVAGEIDTQILAIVPEFANVYKKWKPEKSLKSLTHGQINKIFNSWTSSEPSEKKINYNNLVDKILFLSKTYNVGYTEESKQRVQKKRQKGNEKATSIKERESSDNMFDCINSADEKEIVPDQIQILNSLSAGKNTERGDIWDEELGKNQGIEMNPMRRSTRNMMRSIPFSEFSNQRLSLFESKKSQQIRGSLLSRNSGLELKLTNSYDGVKQSTQK